MVTFLFTDIEGSTRLLQHLGERYAGALTEHRRILRDAFARHGGVEVDTQGDSFFVAFVDPAAASAAAIDAQIALEEYAWPDGVPLRVRMGLHSGQPLVVGDHYVGIDVVRAARIAAAAHGAQILVSEYTRTLYGGDGVVGTTLRDLGAHRLKDLPEPERLFQIVIEGLPSSFPPPRVHEEPVESARLPDYSLPPADVPCPYKGLVPFEREDIGLFFGREKFVEELVRRLDESSFLAVVGPSGSGKSSLVRAGLVPELERRSGAARAAITTPGAHPLAELDRAGDASLLVVDQFEELFTLCRTDDERESFIDAILARTSRGSRVIVALRADFYGHCAAYPVLVPALERHHALVGPMAEEELRRAIEQPAERAGLVLEPGLADAMLRDIVGEPGALPLLSQSLLETWRRRSGKMLTLIGYLQAGGVQGSIAKTAEAVYRGSLTARQQALARNIFLRLTELGKGTEDTRRRVRIQELIPREEHAAEVDEVLGVLVDARLVIVDDGTVEVAHEALIRHWPTLRAWLDEDREGTLAHRRLTQAAQEWEALGREPGALYRGTRLAGASDWGESHNAELNELEREFLAASRTASEREVERERRINRRLRGLLAAAVALLLAALAGGTFAFWQRGEARKEARLSFARSLTSAAQANLSVDPERSILLATEAVEATRRHDGTVLREAEEALHNALATSRVVLSVPGIGLDVDFSTDGRTFVATDTHAHTATVRDADTGVSLRTLVGHTAAVRSVEYSRGGHLIATAGGDGRAIVWDARTGEALSSIDVGSRKVFTARFDAQAERLVTLSDDSASVWDIESGRRVGQVGAVLGGAAKNSTGRADGVAFLPGNRLAVARGPARNDGIAFRVLDASSSEEYLTVWSEGNLIDDLDVSPDGALAAVAENNGVLNLWRLPSGKAFDSVSTRQSVSDIAFSADGKRVATAGRDGSIRIWQITPTAVLEQFTLLRHRAPVSRIAFSGDGTRLVSSSVDEHARVWDLSIFGRGEVLTLPADEGFRGPGGVEFASSEQIVTASRVEGTVRVWGAQTEKIVADYSGLACPGGGLEVLDLDVSPDGARVATACWRGSYVFDLATGEQLATLDVGGWVLGVAFGPDGSRVATTEVDGSVRIYDAASGEELAMLAPRTQGSYEGEDIVRVHAIAWSPGGDRLLAMGLRVTSVWDVHTRRLIHELPAGAGVWSSLAAWTPDGANILVGGSSGVDIWDAETGTHVDELATGAEVSTLVLSNDGEHLAFAVNDTTTIWDWQAGEKLLTLPGGGARAAFSPDDSLLAVQPSAGLVQVFALNVGRLLDIARSRVTRSFTDEECREYLQRPCSITP